MRRHGDVGALNCGFGAERDDTGYAAPGDIDAAGKWPGGGLHQRAMAGHAGKAELFKVERQRRAGAQRAGAGDGAIVGQALGIEMPTAADRRQPRRDLGKADAEAGFCKGDIDDRRCHGAGGGNGERAIGAAGAVGGGAERAIGSKAAAAAGVEPRRGDAGGPDDDRTVPRQREIGIDDRQALGDCRDAGVIKPDDAQLHRAGDRWPLRAGGDAQIAAEIGKAKARDGEARHRSGGGEQECAGGRRCRQPRDAADLVGAEPDGIGGDGAVGQPQRRIDADVGEERRDGIVEPGDPRRAAADRHHQRRDAGADDAGNAQVGRLCGTPAKAGGGEAIIDQRLADGAGEPRAEADVAADKLRIDGGRVQQPRGDRDIFEALCADVDAAIDPHIDRRAGKGAGDRGLAVDNFCGGVDGQLRRQQPGRDTREERSRYRLADGGEAAGCAGQCQIGDRFAAKPGIKASGPFRPAAFARQPCVQRRRQAEQRDDGTAVGGDNQAIEIEFVGIRVGIEMEAQRVAAAFCGFAQRQRRQIDQRAALVDVERAADPKDAALPGDGGFKHQPIDAEARDGDIEIGEKGCGTGRIEPGQPQQPEQGGGHAFGGEGFCRQIERPPIEIEAIDFGENPLGIEQLETMDGGDAEDRAIDAIGTDAEADFGFDPRQLADDEAAAVFAVDPADGAIGQHRQRDNDERDRRQHTADAVAGRKAGARGRGRFVHQNAWPMET